MYADTGYLVLLNALNLGKIRLLSDRRWSACARGLVRGAGLDASGLPTVILVNIYKVDAVQALHGALVSIRTSIVLACFLIWFYVWSKATLLKESVQGWRRCAG